MEIKVLQPAPTFLVNYYWRGNYFLNLKVDLVTFHLSHFQTSCRLFSFAFICIECKLWPWNTYHYFLFSEILDVHKGFMIANHELSMEPLWTDYRKQDYGNCFLLSWFKFKITLYRKLTFSSKVGFDFICLTWFC